MASYAMLTNVGRNKEAAALANATALDIAEIAWGDGTRIPAGGETALENEQGRKPVASQGVTAGALNTAFFEILLAENEGPYVIREAGLFDADGDMIAVAYYDPPVNKPLNTVSAHLRINVVFSDLENLIITIDASTAFISASRKITSGSGILGGGDLSVDREFAADFATLAEAEAGARSDKVMSPLRTKQAIQTLAPSPVLATQAEALAGSNNAKTMTPLRVAQAITQAIDALVDGAPGALDTLQELATALGDNDDAIAALTTSIATKLDASAYTAADILAKLITVDGHASGLDADKLDGKEASAFVETSRSITAGTGLTGGGNLSANRTISASIATQAEAEAGTISTKLMTPLRVAQAIAALAGSPSIASTYEAKIGTNNTKMMTPLRVAEASLILFQARVDISGSIYYSQNVTSVVQDGTGAYTVNFPYQIGGNLTIVATAMLGHAAIALQGTSWVKINTYNLGTSTKANKHFNTIGLRHA